MPVPLKHLLAPGQTDDYLAFMKELNHLELSTFERIVASSGLGIAQRELYLLRPEFYHRYGVRPIRSPLLGRIPLLREITTMGAYYLLSKAS